MTTIRYTKKLFLRTYCVVYLFAFVSFYVQIPGLYGNNGIVPARIVLESVKGTTLSERIKQKPSVLWLAPFVGLDTEYAMDVLALIGGVVSFSGLMSQKFCTAPIFAALWSLYYSLSQVGQVFMQWQWDDLLLEGGFLCILLAPFLPIISKSRTRNTFSLCHVDALIFFLLQWLLFRVIFSTNTNKMLSGCPHWWGLDALSYFFESMPLPTAFAWFCHHLPSILLKLTTAYTMITESVGAVMFLVPIRSVRRVAFFNQTFLQLCIMASGNFSFYNVLVLVLLITLLDDDFFIAANKSVAPSVWTYLTHVASVFTHVIVLYAAYTCFKISNSPFDIAIAFSKQQYESHLTKIVMPGVVIFGVLSLLGIMLRMRFRVTIISLPVTILYVIVVVTLYAASAVPLMSLHPATNSTMPKQVYNFYKSLNTHHVVNSHGVWPKLRDSRVEIVFETADHVDGPWREVHMLYKPGHVNETLPFVAPHSPRIDWQMWHASHGGFNEHLWTVSLAYRILTGQRQVLRLLHPSNHVLARSVPKYVRASLYTYEYTSWKERNTNQWWRRTKRGEYLKMFSKNDAALLEYLKMMKLLPDKRTSHVNAFAKMLLESLRDVVATVDASLLVWGLFVSALAIKFTKHCIRVLKQRQ